MELQLLFIYYLISFNSINPQSVNDSEIKEAYKNLIISFFNDTTYIKTGSLLPEPNEIKAGHQPNIIYLKNFHQNNLNTIKLIKREYNNTVAFYKIDDFKNENSELLSKHIINTSISVFENNNKHLLGSLFINGVYILKKEVANHKTIIYFDVSVLNKKQLHGGRGYLVRVVKKNKQWLIDTKYTTWQS